MTVLAGAALTAAWLVLVVPWRVPARPLLAAPSRRERLAVLRRGGPIWGATVAFVAVWLHPVAGLVVLGWPSWREASAVRRSRSEQRHEVVRTLPETADLIGLGIGAGMSVRAAVRHAAAWIDEPYHGVFAASLRRAEAGESFADALDAASVDLDPAGRPLINLLVAAESDGGVLAAGLARVSDEARHRRRSAAEIRARRLPVTMLLPLVLCVLPAFGLLAVAPLVLASLGDLDLGN
jgi:Flp pilus assembly protein TadB